jgi:hypothetical protein
LQLVFRKVVVSLLSIIRGPHSTASFLRGAPHMPHDDEIVARVPLVNFYALGALRKPNSWGEIARTLEPSPGLQGQRHKQVSVARSALITAHLKPKQFLVPISDAFLARGRAAREPCIPQRLTRSRSLARSVLVRAAKLSARRPRSPSSFQAPRIGCLSRPSTAKASCSRRFSNWRQRQDVPPTQRTHGKRKPLGNRPPPK